MKKYTIQIHTIFFLLLPFLVICQTPDFINYQAAVKQDDGSPIANKEVTVSIQIDTDGGSFSQSQSAMTDNFGIIGLQIGGDELKDIDWSEGSARVSVSVSAGSQSISLGTVPIATVPYALYAESSGSSIPGPSPTFEWDGTKIRFEQPDGSFGDFVDLKGAQGNSVKVVGSIESVNNLPGVYAGEIGDMLIVEDTGEGYVWQGGSWLNIGTIQGPTGPKGDEGEQGEIGLTPEHQWAGTEIRFQNSNGTWGEFVDILGPKGDKGDQGEQGDQGPQGPPGNAGNFEPGDGIDITNNTITNIGDTNPNDDLTQNTQLSGEVEGPFNNLKVVGIAGESVSQISPDNGDVLTFADGEWRGIQPESGGITGIAAGGINSQGILSFASPGVTASITSNLVTVTISGASLSPSTASAVVTSRNGLFKVYTATFAGGSVSFMASDNESVYPMNFIIYHN